MILFLGIIVIALAVFAVARRVDVRLALFPAALVLGLLAGNPIAILRYFLMALADSKSVVPICTAMGFAYVLRFTKCDEHLVQLLCKPLRRVRILLIPGAVIVGFLVNIPIVSQASTVVAIGSVLIPLLTAARISPATTGSALLLGASIGGELLNPGAPEYATVAKVSADLLKAEVPKAQCVSSTLTLVLVELAVATVIFWFQSLRVEKREKEKESADCEQPDQAEPDFKVNYLKAAIPLIPVVLLFLTAPMFPVQQPRAVFPVAQAYLVDMKKEMADIRETSQRQKTAELYDARLIGVAMLIGVACASLTLLFRKEDRKEFLGTARAFFEGAGYAYKEIIAIIVVAGCFGEGVKQIELGRVIGQAVGGSPALLLPAAIYISLAVAMLSGSGIAATQTLFILFAEPALQHNLSPVFIGSLVALGGAAGRTMSPVSAVNIMCAQQTGTPSTTLMKRVAIPLLAAVTVGLLVASLRR